METGTDEPISRSTWSYRLRIFLHVKSVSWITSKPAHLKFLTEASIRTTVLWNVMQGTLVDTI